MKPIILLLAAVGCATTSPEPTKQMVAAESARRSADELGARRHPQSQLYLQLADEQLRDAKTAAANNDTVSAERLLERAKVDAELSIALVHDANARERAKQALEAAAAANNIGEMP